MNEPAPSIVEDLRPNRRKPFVLVHVTTYRGAEAFADYAVTMVDHDFVSLGHRPPLPPASRRALVRAAAAVLTDRPVLAVMAREAGKALLPLDGA